MRLTVQAGPDGGRTIAIDERPVTIGRGHGESLQLSDNAVSRHHLTVRLDDSTRPPSLLVLEVAGVNPVWTLVDGQRRVVQPGERVPLEASITLGNTTMRLEADLSAGGSASAGASARGTVEIDATTLHRTRGASRLAALAALGDRLARCGSLQAVYRTATTWAVEAIPAARAIILSPDGTDILAAASSGPVVDLAMSQTLLRRVRTENRAFLVHDVLAEPDLADRRSVQVRGIQGAMAAPAQSLVFYCEWAATDAVAGTYDEHALTLLVCAAQLLDAMADSASERNQLRAVSHQRGPATPSSPHLVGTSPAMRRLSVFLERVAGSQATVLLNGESGTGKELAASMVHALSDRRDRPFVAINCAAIPEGLLESELFGHEKGAFTGAVAQHLGVFERAHTGSLFLDEVGEMSLPTQARMLRVLENRSFTRVGGTKEVEVDVRLIAATHRDLRELAGRNRFREDLLYRLSVIQTELPSLRERREDISALVRHFADLLGEAMGRRIESISPQADEVLTRYNWPGNVRELRNVVERALVLGDGPVLELDDLPPELMHQASSGTRAVLTDGGQILPLVELERQAIQAALAATEGNKARAAALLGIDRSTLYRKLKDLDL
jgi:DNA-binding NtrC family response regulator